MNYCEIKTTDIANGPGVRVSLFVSGCRHACEGCFNKEAWDFAYGNPFTPETEEQLLAALRPAYVQGLTLLGGEPMEPENIPALRAFVKRVREEVPGKDIWCFSGSVFETLIKRDDAKELLNLVDVLVDGPYVAAKRNLMLRFRGSENQRLLDIPKSMAAGCAVEWTE